MVVSNYADNSMSVLLGHGDGTLSAPIVSPTGSAPEAMAVADFDGDGTTDVAVLNLGDKTLGVLLGHGDGTFATQLAYASGKNAIGLSTADFNGDGHPDVVVSDHGNDVVGIYLSFCQEPMKLRRRTRRSAHIAAPSRATENTAAGHLRLSGFSGETNE